MTDAQPNDGTTDQAALAALGRDILYWRCENSLCMGIKVWGFSTTEADQHIRLHDRARSPFGTAGAYIRWIRGRSPL